MGASTVAIVGGGCSGLPVAAQILRQGFRGAVTMIEPRADRGRGLAYSTPYQEHLLNVPAGKMSALPDQPGHFLEWLRAGEFPDAPAALFALRRVYGRYLGSVLEREMRRDGAVLRHVRAEANAVRLCKSDAEIALSRWRPPAIRPPSEDLLGDAPSSHGARGAPPDRRVSEERRHPDDRRQVARGARGWRRDWGMDGFHLFEESVFAWVIVAGASTPVPYFSIARVFMLYTSPGERT